MTSHEVQLPGAGAVYCEKRAVKRILDKNTEANTFPQNVAKVRKESEDEKTGDCLRTDISKYVQPTSKNIAWFSNSMEGNMEKDVASG